MIDDLLKANRAWAAAKVKGDPEFFLRLVAQQTPEYLWIGCSDSRVPANEIVDLAPGEMFVHRNVANLANPTDLNFLAVLQYSVEVLKVRRILVVGHYGCGGVKASMAAPVHGLVDHWIGPLRQLYETHRSELMKLDEHARHDRLVELNALEQARLVNANPVVVNARGRGQAIGVHAWVYSLRTGLITDLHAPVPPSAPDPGPSSRDAPVTAAPPAQGQKGPAKPADAIVAPVLRRKKRGLFGGRSED